MRLKITAILSVGLSSLLLAPYAVSAQDTSLINLKLEPQITVSGLSSGGYMAAQYHLAHAEQVSGVAILAAGPIYCAQNSLSTALSHCFNQADSQPDLAAIQHYLKQQQQKGNLASDQQLQHDKVWILNGSKDTTVLPKLGFLLAQQYLQFVNEGNIKYIADNAFGHTFPTDRPNLGSCDTSESPFIASCNYDAAGSFLNYLLGSIKPKAAKTSGNLVNLNQHQLSASAKNSLAETGYVYIPQRCAAGESCRLHVSFHGCKQNAQFVDQTYVTSTDLNNYADTNNLVVFYPQTTKSMFNPNACWDWWGYSGEHYATREGVQISAVNELIKHLLNP